MIDRYYRKIPNVFKFDEKYRKIVGTNEPFLTLRDIDWVGTEKIDGTSIVVHYDGERIEFGGHTKKSEIPKQLNEYLTNLFLTKEMEYVFEQMFENKEVYIYGEGFGSKIQTNGDKYIEGDNVGFIIFEINVAGFDLVKDDVFDISDKLGIPHVPIVFTGKLYEAIDFVKCHHFSTLNGGLHEMEGIVIEPKIMLYDKRKELIKGKIKWCDIVKGGLV